MQHENISNQSARGSALALRLTVLLILTGAASQSSFAQTNTLVPSSCVNTLSTFTGSCSSIGNTPLQTGTGNTASDEIVLHGQYTGYQVFTLPTSVAPSSVTGIRVKVNYQGPSHNRQVWTWQLFNWSTNAYVTVGDNSAITPPLDWLQWTVFNFSAAGTLANYVRASDGQMRVQIFSNNAADDTYIDYEAVIVTSTAGVSVSVSPTAATLIGGGTQQFSATVTGSTNTAVTWSVTGAGTVSTAGLYTAPATVASTTTATVKATSVADTTKSASATITINPVSVAISPTTVSLGGGGTQQFTATVTNGGGTGVTWSLTGLGTVSTSGLYTAPATVSATSTATVTATSTKDATKSAAATVALNPPAAISVAVSPTSASLGGGGTQQFTATVTGTSNTAVTWSLTGAGILSTSGLYTAPATISSISTATVKATSVADTTKSTSAIITLNPVSVSVSPSTASVATAATQQFTATVSNTSNTAVTWQVNTVVGGNATVGTISTAGLYTAPAAVPSPATVTVQTVSQADNTKSGTAIVTVTAVSAIPLPLHGVTVADDNDIRTSSYLNQVLTSLGNLSVTPTVRIVYTRSVGGNGDPASGYLSATQQIKTNRYILGQVVDSGYMPCYTVAQHSARWQDYISTMGNSVDIWEVGNEINGSWLYNKNADGTANPDFSASQCTPAISGSGSDTHPADVVTKMTDAYNQAKTAGKATALTLFFNVDSTCAATDPTMTSWASTNVPTSMKNGLDYVLVSFYPQWCTSNPYTYSPDWNTVFSNLRSIFPNAKLGMGEIGWDSSFSKPSNANLTTLIQTDSRIKPTSVTNWAAGGFYWEFGIDAVPYNGTAGSIWNVINTELTNQ